MYDGVVSDLQYVLSGVPQGSILGPLLFLIAYIIMYADDTVIYTSDKSFATIESNLTKDFARVVAWLVDYREFIFTENFIGI